MDYFDGVTPTTLHKSLDFSSRMLLHSAPIFVVVVFVGQGCLIKRHSVTILTAVRKRVANFRLYACWKPHTRAASLSLSSLWFRCDVFRLDT